MTSYQVVTTRSAILPSDNMAQSDGGGLGGFAPFEAANFSRSAMLLSDNVAQNDGGGFGFDYKGAQPPHLADKRREGTLSAVSRIFGQYVFESHDNLQQCRVSLYSILMIGQNCTLRVAITSLIADDSHL